MTKLADILLCNLATLGPIGHLRPAPGTIGSLVALGTGYLIAKFSLGVLVAAILAISILGIFAAERYGQRTGKKDASEVIIDEVAGQWIPLVIIPLEINGISRRFCFLGFLISAKLARLVMPKNLPAVLALWQMIWWRVFWPHWFYGLVPSPWGMRYEP